jgi:hypothetical protein
MLAVLVYICRFMLLVECVINLSKYCNQFLLLLCTLLLLLGFLSIRAASILAFISTYTR